TVTFAPIAAPVDTRRSPHATHRPVPVDAVTLDDPIWAPRIRANRAQTIPGQFRHLEETDRLNNLRRVAGAWDGPYVGREFNDSDVDKWLEAASWALVGASEDERAQIAPMMDTAIGVLEAAQGPDGYLNSYYSVEREAERWSNLRDRHELYCAGHLF